MQLDFSENFFEAAYRFVLYNMCKTEHDKRLFTVLCEISSKYGMTVQKLTDLLNELTQRTQEAEDAHD